MQCEDIVFGERVEDFVDVVVAENLEGHLLLGFCLEILFCFSVAVLTLGDVAALQKREREREVMICGQWCVCSAEERMPSERDGGREVGRERG